jgi:urea transport system permease protein
VPKTRIFIMLLAVLCVTAVAVTMKYTAMGRRIRAVVQHRDLAETSGISSRGTDITTFFIGSGLAGVAGVALTLIGSTSSNTGTTYLVDAFLVVVIGGLGQIRGAVLAAVALGLLNSFIEYSTTASVAKVIVFVVIVVFLQVRPQGLFTIRSRSLV